MTTFTITCPPTVAEATSVILDFITSSFTNTELIDQGADEGHSAQFTTDAGFTIITNASSDVITTATDIKSQAGIAPECGGNFFAPFPYVGYSESTSNSAKTIQSFNGARTEESGVTASPNCPADFFAGASGGTTIWTAFAGTSSQTTTTQTATVYITRVSDTTNVTTRSGTTVQTGTMTAAEPRTTVTQTQFFSTKTAVLSTTRIETTTQQDNFFKWRTGEGGETHRGSFQSATVVCLETSNLAFVLRPELAWIVTNRPAFTATSTAAVEQQQITQFTVFPSFFTTAGHVEEGTRIFDEDFVLSFSTSSEIIETPTTYKTTVATATTITIALNFSALPSPLNQQAGTTVTTAEWFSTINEFRFTGGDTSKTSAYSNTTYMARIGLITWNAIFQSTTTRLSSFAVSTVSQFSTVSTVERTLPNSNEVPGTGETNQIGENQTQAITFQRAISVIAGFHAPAAAINQCGSSLSFAVAAASNPTSAAQEIGAAGISVTFPPLVQGARTARVPLGSWRYVTGGSAGTTISASAGPASLSVTSAFGPASDITTSSTEGPWTLAGAAVSRANLPGGQRINLGGVAPTAAATAFYDAGIFATSDKNGSGILEVSEARTEIIDPTAERTAYLPATGVLISGGSRFDASLRNITQTIAESAIITNRDQLIL